MSPAKTYNLLLSHSWSHGDDYNRLINLLNERPYFIYKDYSVPKDDPIHNAPNSRALYDAIKRQMAPCHVIIIMAGVYSTYSTWIQNEIKIAKNGFNTPKPIVAVKPRGNINVSTVVSQAADRLVGWSTESVITAIREVSI